MYLRILVVPTLLCCLGYCGLFYIVVLCLVDFGCFVCCVIEYFLICLFCVLCI